MRGQPLLFSQLAFWLQVVEIASFLVMLGAQDFSGTSCLMFIKSWIDNNHLRLEVVLSFLKIKSVSCH